MMAVNIILIIIGYMFIDKDFGYKTLYSSFALSGMVWLLEKLFPLKASLTGDPMLELVYAILLPAIGSGIVFNLNASTGGTDIVAKILSRHAHLNIGKTLLLVDFIIASSAGLVFGIAIGMYSVLGLIMKAFFIDFVIEGLNMNKQMVIVTDTPDDIKNYIIRVLKRGLTVHLAKGGFTNEDKYVITTVLNRKQAGLLRVFIRETDNKAFVTISNTSEILGKGFRNADL
jgi:uncharacterized membrane-anchored protein YitT (DUF2179 family)